jgi:hypothetical protein
MSIRLDPRRVNALKHMASEAGVRPGDLVRQWVEERIDGARGGSGASGVTTAPGGQNVLSRLEALTARVAALESATGAPQAPTTSTPAEDAPVEPTASEPMPTEAHDDRPESPAPANRVSAAPTGERVALHDEMIAVIRERGPMSAGDLASAIVERGRYLVPRSGKPLDAKTVSQRVSNPTYRSRFMRREGRIGLADES